MLVIEMIGGLGNQLFQIAFGYVLSLQRNQELYFANFNRNFCNERPSYWNTYFSHLSPLIKNNPNRSEYLYYIDPHPLEYHIPPISNKLYMYGFFQNLKYYQGYERQIKEILNIPNFQTIDRCSIHFRLGDYRKASNFPILDDNYYLTCIDKIKCNNWIIFCEKSEQNYIKERIKNFNILGTIEFFSSDEKTEIIEMSKSKYQIIANSSFSLFAALISNSDTKIFYPNIWFGDHNLVIENDKYEMIEAKDMK